MKKEVPNKIYIVIDKNNEIVLDSQRRPTMYRSFAQLTKYLYKLKDTDKVIVYGKDEILTKYEIENEILCQDHQYDRY